MDSPINASPLPNHHQTPSPPPAKPLESPESGDRRPSKLGTRTPGPELLPCPRCDSINTKFCYYNNYNLSQPRHFCKSCRRYWTRGGALRNIPVGGSSRKTPASSNKRPRLSTTSAASSSNKSSLVSCSKDNEVFGKSQNLDPIVSGTGSAMDGARSLNCWWNGVGLLPLNGYGFGLLPGLDCGNGILDWPVVEEVSNRGDGGAAAVSGEASGCGGGAWQVGGGGVAEGSDHYLCWPELAISTPANALDS